MNGINVIGSNYVLVSIDEGKLLSDIQFNRDDAIKLRAKMHHDFITAVERFIKREPDVNKRKLFRTPLMGKMPMYTMIIHHYERLAEKWDERGLELPASVARVLMENERLNLYQYDSLLYYNGI